MQIIRSLRKLRKAAVITADVALVMGTLATLTVLPGLFLFDKSRAVFDAYYTRQMPVEFTVLPWHR